MKKPYNTFLLISLFIIIFTISVSAEFVEVRSIFADIRVRVLPETESRIVGEALEGDIFRYKSEENDWVEIEMFSGDSRYIHRSQVEVLTRGISAPFTNDICPKLMERLEEAKERNLSESDDISRNILFDRYVLDIFHEFNLQPAIYQMAVNQCIEDTESKIWQKHSEKKEGYTLSVPTEKPGFYEEIFSENKPYDFRETSWGMSKEQVKLAENKKLDSEEDNKLIYSVEIYGRDYYCTYFFSKNKLHGGIYYFKGKYINKNSYVINYKRLKESLTKKYGKSISGSEKVARWETPITSISLALFDTSSRVELLILYSRNE